MVVNTSKSPMIAIRLIDKTVIIAKKFKVSRHNIWADDLKYMGDDKPPVFLEDSMLFNMDAVETYMILHKGGKNGEEIPEDRDDSPSPTQHVQ